MGQRGHLGCPGAAAGRAATKPLTPPCGCSEGALLALLGASCSVASEFMAGSSSDVIVEGTVVTAPTRCCKALDVRNARTARGARAGERRRPARAAVRPSSTCPAARLTVGGLRVGPFCLLHQGARMGRKNGSGIVFGHLGNDADSLNAVIYVQCEFPRSESRACAYPGPSSTGPGGYRPLTPAGLQANESRAPYRGGWPRSPPFPPCLRSVVTAKEEGAVLCSSGTDARGTAVNTAREWCR